MCVHYHNHTVQAIGANGASEGRYRRLDLSALACFLLGARRTRPACDFIFVIAADCQAQYRRQWLSFKKFALHFIVRSKCAFVGGPIWTL